jgi:hypothetical protein
MVTMRTFEVEDILVTSFLFTVVACFRILVLCLEDLRKAFETSLRRAGVSVDQATYTAESFAWDMSYFCITAITEWHITKCKSKHSQPSYGKQSGTERNSNEWSAGTAFSQ